MPDATNLALTRTAVVDAAGNATITITPTSNVQWLIRQVSAAMETAPSGASCVMRKNGAFVTFMIPTGDAAGGDPPLMLGPGDRLTLEWTLATPDDTATALVLYDRVGWSA